VPQRLTKTQPRALDPQSTQPITTRAAPPRAIIARMRIKKFIIETLRLNQPMLWVARCDYRDCTRNHQSTTYPPEQSIA
jgi:hypothetical protein